MPLLDRGSEDMTNEERERKMEDNRNKDLCRSSQQLPLDVTKEP